jgi:hypothetical protein
VRLVSLTQELKKADSPITAFFKERFPNVDPVAGAFDAQFAQAQTLSLHVARNPFPYATIGTAIDYRLCYYFWTTPYRALPAFNCARTFDSRYPALGDTADHRCSLSSKSAPTQPRSRPRHS